MAEQIRFRDVLLGLTGRDFTIIAASKAAMRGVTILKATDDKTRQLSEHTVIAYAGEAGDTGKRFVVEFFTHIHRLRHLKANRLISPICRIYTSQHCPLQHTQWCRTTASSDRGFHA